MTNEEVLCTFMDGPKPDIRCEETEWPFLGRNAQGRRYTWWLWERDLNGHMCRNIGLEECYQVEECLSPTMRKAYVQIWMDLGITRAPGKTIFVFDWAEQIWPYMHASPAQRVFALAALLKPLVEQQ